MNKFVRCVADTGKFVIFVIYIVSVEFVWQPIADSALGKKLRLPRGGGGLYG